MIHILSDTFIHMTHGNLQEKETVFGVQKMTLIQLKQSLKRLQIGQKRTIYQLLLASLEQFMIAIIIQECCTILYT